MANHPKEHVFQDNQEKEITEDAHQKYNNNLKKTMQQHILKQKEDGEQGMKEEEEKSVGSNDPVDILEDLLNFLDTVDKNSRRVKYPKISYL